MSFVSRTLTLKMFPHATPNDVFRALRNRNVKYTGLVARLAYKQSYVARKSPIVSSVLLTNDDLDLPNNATYGDVYKAGGDLGNRRCSPQFIFSFAIVMAGFSPNRTYVHFASDPIEIDGQKYIVSAYKNGKTTKLKLIKYYETRRCSGNTIWVFTR